MHTPGTDKSVWQKGVFFSNPQERAQGYVIVLFNERYFLSTIGVDDRSAHRDSKVSLALLLVRTHVIGILVALFWLCIPCFSTTLIAIADVHNRQIVIAADSLVRYRYMPAQSQCKIHVVTDDCAFAMSGMYAQETPAFDLTALGQSACGRTSGDLKQRADGFLSTAFPQVVGVIKYLATTDPSYLKEQYEGKPVIEVMFIGQYRHQAVVFVRGAILESGRLKPDVKDVPFDTKVVVGGVNDHIATYIISHPRWKRHGYISAAHQLVRIEASAHPTMVGFPISIGTVDGGGRFHWVERGSCSEDKP